MPRKREPTFSGPLLEPIRSLNALMGEDQQRSFVTEQRAVKLRLLAKHYGIENLDNPGQFETLTMCLAAEFVPGFAVIRAPPKKAGRRPGTGKIDQRELVDFIDDCRKHCADQRIPFNLAKLCRILTGPNGPAQFRGLNAPSLQTAYHARVQKEKAREAQFSASLRARKPAAGLR